MQAIRDVSPSGRKPPRDASLGYRGVAMTSQLLTTTLPLRASLLLRCRSEA
jgi:hypothetical protein